MGINHIVGAAFGVFILTYIFRKSNSRRVKHHQSTARTYEEFKLYRSQVASYFSCFAVKHSVAGDDVSVEVLEIVDTPTGMYFDIDIAMPTIDIKILLTVMIAKNLGHSKPRFSIKLQQFDLAEHLKDIQDIPLDYLRADIFEVFIEQFDQWVTQGKGA